MPDRLFVRRDPRAEKVRDFRNQYGHRRRWPRMADLKRRRAAKLAARRARDLA